MVKVNVKYELGHTIKEFWEKTEYYCPNCGKKSVWVEHGGGDYYQGPLHICIKCESSFTMPNLETFPDWQDKQRIDAIKGS